MISNYFERVWFIIFMAMYVLIMLPLPFYFNTEYIPGWFGVPIFVYGWMLHGITVLVLIVVYAYLCLKRPEYQDNVPEEQ
ncbi:hypothetical protein G3601_004886 [Salmonella enterica]|nr:hypothetical protein [Salmonella enterica]EBS3849503.1 hypothetical protein [Salmonella enterica subsp. enterica serovar Java]EDX3986939.1 hypothetical protein [Salmonella enterica subsp. enterica serovar 4,[5],12:b:-]EEE5612335.1 hypothetical protein [Salmonella enterica subsp. enterica serovar Typhimurium]EKN5803775.1 hypothetical protein [Salmonella enterica subsp. enterica]